MRFAKQKEFVCLLAAAAISVPLGAKALDLPKDWAAAGSNPASYEMGVDKEGVHGGKACAVIRNKDPKPIGFGTIMQTADAKPYLGKRVRLSAWVKAKDIADWAGLWFRVDKGASFVSFDNMQDRPLKGSFDWKKVEIVLDVPRDSTSLAYGLLLNGTGSAWLDDLKFEKVSKKVKLTSKPAGKIEPPHNLDFEK